MELNEVVARRRMCRSFSDRPVPSEALDRALALATHAPSAGNTQGWAFVVLEGAETEKFWRHTAEPSWLERPDHPGLLRAPAIVVPLASRASYVERYSEPDKVGPDKVGPDKVGTGEERVGEWQVPYWLVDTGFATMLFLLGLRQEGLGALFFALHRPASALLEELGVPPGWEPLGAIALGWPAPDDKAGSSASRPRKQVGEVVHRGSWHTP